MTDIIPGLYTTGEVSGVAGGTIHTLEVSSALIPEQQDASMSAFPDH